MTPKISLRLALWTEYGPCGARLQRGVPLPTYDFNFPDTEEGRRQAVLAQGQIQDYVDRYHVSRSKN